jgi:pinin
MTEIYAAEDVDLLEPYHGYQTKILERLLAGAERSLVDLHALESSAKESVSSRSSRGGRLPPDTSHPTQGRPRSPDRGRRGVPDSSSSSSGSSSSKSSSSSSSDSSSRRSASSGRSSASRSRSAGRRRPAKLQHKRRQDSSERSWKSKELARNRQPVAGSGKDKLAGAKKPERERSREQSRKYKRRRSSSSS